MLTEESGGGAGLFLYRGVVDSPEAARCFCWLSVHALVFLKSTIISFVLLTLTERLLSLLWLSGCLTSSQRCRQQKWWYDWTDVQRCSQGSAVFVMKGVVTVWGLLISKSRTHIRWEETVLLCMCWCALSALVSVAKPSIKLPWQPSVHHPIHHPRATDRTQREMSRTTGEITRGEERRGSRGRRKRGNEEKEDEERGRRGIMEKWKRIAEGNVQCLCIYLPFLCSCPDFPKFE